MLKQTHYVQPAHHCISHLWDSFPLSGILKDGKIKDKEVW